MIDFTLISIALTFFSGALVGIGIYRYYYLSRYYKYQRDLVIEWYQGGNK